MRERAIAGYDFGTIRKSKGALHVGKTDVLRKLMLEEDGISFISRSRSAAVAIL